MKGSEKQSAYAESIMRAIEGTETPDAEMDHNYVVAHKELIALLRAIDAGAGMEELEAQAAQMTDDRMVRVAQRCMDPRSVKNGAPVVSAGKVIDELKDAYYKVYGPEGRLSK